MKLTMVTQQLKLFPFSHFYTIRWQMTQMILHHTLALRNDRNFLDECFDFEHTENGKWLKIKVMWAACT